VNPVSYATPTPAPVAPVTPAAPARAAAPKAKSITAEQRYKMIQEAAYYIAQRKGFKSDPLLDWEEAEADIERKLRG
ncbi:MAG: DUF2934 domain-containing protein, partial [Kiritimatiellae bacterium]|nr:DUF2934 domain-containing protein [Kiritimatiellia bacterium]